MEYLIDRIAWDDPEARRLRQAQREELDKRYGTDDHEPGEPPSADSVTVFLVARADDGTAVGCGGLRGLDAHTAEIKRMYVDPRHRGNGAATALLRALERESSECGISRLLLETGPAQPDAIRFYEREGYERIENFGPYRGEPLSVCYARSLIA